MNTPIDPLADFRPDGFGLDDERRARLRSRVLDAIPDDPPAGVTTLVAARSAAPAPTVPGGDDDLAGLQVLEPLPAGDRGRSPASRRHAAGHGHNGRRLLVAAAVAVALGLLAVVVGTTRSTDRQVGTLDPSSFVTLEALAQQAERGSDRPLAAGEYQYFELTLAQRPDDGVFDGTLDIAVDRNWHTVDDSGAHQTTTKVRPAGALPGNETDVTVKPFVDDPACLQCFGPFTYAAMRSAPSDPEALLDAARAAMPGAHTWEVAEQLTTLASLTTTPPAVRAGALRALAELGFRPIGEVTPPSGPSGIGFSLDTADGTEVVVFDPSSATGRAYWHAPVGSATGWQAATSWVTLAGVAITGPPA